MTVLIPAVPTPVPQANDTLNFDARADAHVAWYPSGVAAMNEQNAENNAINANVNAQALAVAQISDTTPWNAATNYAVGTAVFDPVNFLTYRRRVAGVSATRPGLDATNWAIVGSTGDVTLDGVQTLTNKTLTGYTETVFALTGLTPAIDASNGTVQTWVLTGNSTPTIALASGQNVTLMIDDGSGSTIAWPSVTWKSNGGAAPALNLVGQTVIVLWRVGTVIYGARVGDS